MSKCRNLMMGICALFAATLISCSAQAQNKAEAIPYGANPAAGHHLRVDDVNIYYETYGSGGTPLALLHGGLYGYIEEFGERALSQTRISTISDLRTVWQPDTEGTKASSQMDAAFRS